MSEDRQIITESRHATARLVRPSAWKLDYHLLKSKNRYGSWLSAAFVSTGKPLIEMSWFPHLS
jgi:hypothetical protein